jgi:hypothetical protein
MFSGVGEVINLYVDSKAREAFLGTCRRYVSGVKLVKLIDYNIKAKNPATVNLLFTLANDSTGAPTTYTGPIIIPKGTQVTSSNSSTIFRTLQDVTLPAGQSSIYSVAAQYSEVVNENLGSTNGTARQKIQLPYNYVHGSLRITVGGTVYTLYNFFGQMLSNWKGYVVEIDENQDAYLVFGDGTNGIIPPNSQTILASYKTTDGVLGNLSPGLLTTIASTMVTPTGYVLTVTNPDYASGGEDFEGLEQLRDRAPRSIRTLDRAVTYQDYIDIAMQVLGVGAAEVCYSCGKYVNLYVAPSSKGVATPALVSQVQDYIDPRRMITTKVDVRSAGVTRVWLQGVVYGKPLYTATEIQREVYDALDTEFGIGKLKINKKVSATDIIALVEGLNTVETFQLEKVKIEPYARPVLGNTHILNVEWTVLPKATTRVKYSLIYKSATSDFQLYKNGIFLQNVAVGSAIADGDNITFKVLAGTYSDNDKWEFEVSPSYPEIFPNVIIEVKDFSAPIIDVSPKVDDNTPRTIFSNITIQTQGTASNALPSCS